MDKRERYEGLAELLIELQGDDMPFNRLEKTLLIITVIFVLCALYLLVGLYI